MYALPEERWRHFLSGRLADSPNAAALNFEEVYVTGFCDEGGLILQIKQVSPQLSPTPWTRSLG